MTLDLKPEPGGIHRSTVAIGTVVLGIALSPSSRRVMVLCEEPVLPGMPPMPDAMSKAELQITRLDEGAQIDDNWQYAGSVTHSQTVEHYFWRLAP